MLQAPPTDVNAAWKVVAAICAGIILLGTAWTVLKNVLGRVAATMFDAAVVGAIGRRGADVERYLREQVFPTDLADSVETRELAERALKSAEDNGVAIQRLAETQSQQGQLLAELPHISRSLEASTATLERVADTVGALGNHVSQLSGAMAVLLSEHGMKLPENAALPVSRLGTTGRVG